MRTCSLQECSAEGSASLPRVRSDDMLRARFAAIHAAHAEREAAEKASWKHESEALSNQIAAMEETIKVVEREIRSASAALDKQDDASQADREMLRGQLEDKLLTTQTQLEEARRAYYFPRVEGYQLRFSFGENFLGFKELLLERLCGTITISATPGLSRDGHTQLPAVRLQWQGSGDEPGVLLRFMGEGVSLVSRRELLGIALAPNLSLQRVDLSARFAADFPLVYQHRRRAWRLGDGFKVELLHFRQEDSAAEQGGATEQALRHSRPGARQLLTRSALGRCCGCWCRWWWRG